MNKLHQILITLNKIHNKVESFEQHLNNIEAKMNKLTEYVQQNDELQSIDEKVQNFCNTLCLMKQHKDQINGLLSAFFDIQKLFYYHHFFKILVSNYYEHKIIIRFCFLYHYCFAYVILRSKVKTTSLFC